MEDEYLGCYAYTKFDEEKHIEYSRHAEQAFSKKKIAKDSRSKDIFKILRFLPDSTDIVLGCYGKTPLLQELKNLARPGDDWLIPAVDAMIKDVDTDGVTAKSDGITVGNRGYGNSSGFSVKEARKYLARRECKSLALLLSIRDEISKKEDPEDSVEKKADAIRAKIKELEAQLAKLPQKDLAPKSNESVKTDDSSRTNSKEKIEEIVPSEKASSTATLK